MKMYVPVLNEKIKIIFKFVRMQSTGAGGRLSATMHLPSSLVTCVPYPEPTRREENTDSYKLSLTITHAPWHACHPSARMYMHTISS